MGLLERLVEGALRHPLFVLLCLGAAVATGVAAVRELPVEAFPDLTNNQVVVIADAPEFSALEVEQRITYPIESALIGVPNAEEVRSISKFGLSLVTVVFDDAMPIYLARQLVAERLGEARARLPASVEPALGPVASA
ncbi:MAG TPA: efflux RND transporter permease subunit, partial [Vicinamibacteria bacterium]